jgi:hypothetical protein
MAWLAVSLVAFFLYAVAVVTDKFMLTKTPLVPLSYAFYICLMSAAASPIVYALASLVWKMPVRLLAVGKFFLPRGIPLIAVLVCGVAQFLGLLFMFEAVLRGEVSKASPMIVSLQPVVSLLLTVVLPPLFALAAPGTTLGLELVKLHRLPGVVMVVAGSYLLSQAGEKKTWFTPGTWMYVLLAGVLLGTANVFAAISYAVFDQAYLPAGAGAQDQARMFLKAFMWTRWMALVGALGYVVLTGRFSAIRRRKPAGAGPVGADPGGENPGDRSSQVPTPAPAGPVGGSPAGGSPAREVNMRGRWIPLVFLFGQGCGALAVVLQQYAIKLGNVVVVTSLGGVQFFFVIALSAIFSRFFPRLFSESSTRRALLQKVLWSALLFGGIVVLAI